MLLKEENYVSPHEAKYTEFGRYLYNQQMLKVYALKVEPQYISLYSLVKRSLGLFNGSKEDFVFHVAFVVT
jgi:hypothetical protein